MNIVRAAAWLLFLGIFVGGGYAQADDDQGPRLKTLVDAVIAPVMAEHDIPGLAVALTVKGQRYFFYYGLAARESGPKVSGDTLFEIGSVSKILTSTLAAYGQALGVLSLSAPASQYWPALKGSGFDGISLLNLATYTAGGLPLQLPGEVGNDKKMLAYFKNWRPAYPAGTHRQYSNSSIGLLGYITAVAMAAPFEDLMQNRLFPALGLDRTYIRVPQEHEADYAYGYSQKNQPLRARPAVLAAEAYGVKTTAPDLLRFLELSMSPETLPEELRQAIITTQIGYFQVGDMFQGLGWEMYDWPVTLDTLLAGLSAQRTSQTVVDLTSLAVWRADVWLHKTGSMSGFGSYVVCLPSEKIALVLLANKNYPAPARIQAVYEILEGLQ